MVIKLFKKIFARFKFQYVPRYHLALDSEFFDIKNKNNIYRFKVYNNHVYLKFSYEEIMHNKNIVFDVNPFDLIKIAQLEERIKIIKEKIHIKEMLRHNLYLLTDGENNNVFTGEEICNNPLLIEKIKSIDVYKIAFHTGFQQGRQLHNEISSQKTQKSILTLVKNQGR